jgi:hypothetical protein
MILERFSTLLRYRFYPADLKFEFNQALFTFFPCHSGDLFQNVSAFRKRFLNGFILINRMVSHNDIRTDNRFLLFFFLDSQLMCHHNNFSISNLLDNMFPY